MYEFKCRLVNVSLDVVPKVSALRGNIPDGTIISLIVLTRQHSHYSTPTSIDSLMRIQTGKTYIAALIRNNPVITAVFKQSVAVFPVITFNSNLGMKCG